MGLATPTPTTTSSNLVLQTHLNPRSDSTPTKIFSTSSDWKSMSQGFHNQGTFGFPDGFERPNPTDQQSQRDQRVRIMQELVPGEPSEDPTTIYEPNESNNNMFSEMFSFNQPAPSLATDLLAREISLAGYRHDVSVPIEGLNPDTMHLYLMNPSQHDRQPQPPPPQPQQGLIFHYGGGGGGGGGVRQGLDLSLSPSPQELVMTKGEELYYNTPQTQHQLHQHQHNQGLVNLQSQHMVHVGYGGGMGVVNVPRHSKYAKAAQELLGEFCSVGRGQGKKGRRNPNPNINNNASSSGHGASTSKDPSGAPPALSPSDKFEHQRRKAKLLSMLDEVDRRYNHYCDQMQMVVNSFDSIMGFGSATPYTSLAQTAMSKHFRCLKDAIVAQLRRTCEALGEKDGGSGTGITKGETPRLKLLEQTLRHQRAFHQMGMAEQEAWRPQRGLPENSVNILRAWLFEHFLHPYPSDADKHLLARKTGLSRNQVTNWFINARVRLWKPMVEEMYQQEAIEEEERERGESSNQTSQSQRQEFNLGYAPSQNVVSLVSNSIEKPGPSHAPYPTLPNQPDPIGFPDPNSLCAGQTNEAMVAEIMDQTTHMRRGALGDVSLTLGLRQTGNVSENSRFTLRDFNGGG